MDVYVCTINSTVADFAYVVSVSFAMVIVVFADLVELVKILLLAAANVAARAHCFLAVAELYVPGQA
jgi:hypothetical protein